MGDGIDRRSHQASSLVTLTGSVFYYRSCCMSSLDSKGHCRVLWPLRQQESGLILLLIRRYKAACGASTVTFTLYKNPPLNMQQDECTYSALCKCHRFSPSTCYLIHGDLCASLCKCVCMLRLPLHQTDGIIMTSLHTGVMFSEARSRRKKLGGGIR